MRYIRILLCVFVLSSLLCAQELVIRYWGGTLQNQVGEAIKGATIHLVGKDGTLVSNTGADGHFQFPNLAPGEYKLKITVDGKPRRFTEPLKLKTDSLPAVVTITSENVVAVAFRSDETAKTGGGRFSAQLAGQFPLTNAA